MYILLGQDEYSLNQSLEAIKRGTGDQALLAANTTTLDGQQITLDGLRTVCETLPFLAEKRLVIIKGLLERFEPRRGSNRRKKVTRVANRQNECKSLDACIGQLPESTILVLIDGNINSRNPLLSELSPKAKVKSFPLLRGTRLRQWIQKHVTEEGGIISPQAVDLLAKLVGGNLWIMANEINKLVLFTSGRRIEEEDVSRLVSYAQQSSVFAMVDAILDFKAGLAEQLLQQLMQKGASSAYLLVMLSWQVRRIVRIKELINQRKSEIEIRSKLSLASDFAWRKTKEQSGRYPLERIKEVYRKLLEADLSIKTGKYDGELALNILIVELCWRDRMEVAHPAQTVVQPEVDAELTSC
ncbi:DNA polymerase III subunit delta [Chloroflexota bacterium]